MQTRPPGPSEVSPNKTTEKDTAFFIYLRRLQAAYVLKRLFQDDGRTPLEICPSERDAAAWHELGSRLNQHLNAPDDHITAISIIIDRLDNMDDGVLECN